MTSEFTIAVHALVYLNYKSTTLSSDELAENICTNSARIRKIMSKLKKAGLIETKEGIHGGYSLKLNPSSITLKQISEAININIVSSLWQTGNSNINCVISSNMAGVMNDIYSNLDNICKIELEGITINDINKQIFKIQI